MSIERLVWFYLWAGPHVLLTVVAIMMFRKGLHKKFPVFFFYLWFEFLEFAVLFSMYYLRAGSNYYYQVDLFTRAGSIALHFGIIQEMFEAPVAHSVPLRRATARILNWMIGVLVVFSVVFVFSIYYTVVPYRHLQDYVSLEAFNTAQCGLLVLVFLWHRFLGFWMSPVVFGVALGVGLVAGSEPLIHILKELVPAPRSMMVDDVQFAIFHIAVVGWLYYVHSRETIPANPEPAFLLQGRDWAAELEKRITPL